MSTPDSAPMPRPTALNPAAIRARMDASLARDLWHPALDDVKALLTEHERLVEALTQIREALREHFEAVQSFATMPAVGDHGDTRWGEGYKRASEHEVDALKPVLAIIASALDGPRPTPSSEAHASDYGTPARHPGARGDCRICPTPIDGSGE